MTTVDNGNRRCRVHMWIGDTCGLCGATDPHKHCYSDWHVCWTLGPTEHDHCEAEPFTTSPTTGGNVSRNCSGN